jgi:hypothetical protein
LLSEINEGTLSIWKERLLVERLESKTEGVAKVLTDVGNHWEEAFYRLLARHFGLSVNVEPFEWLASATPLSLLWRHRQQLLQVEALLFGQAGLLEEPFADEYPLGLAKEYRFLKHKYGLQPMDRSVWKFFRLRPAGFPTVRIAQLAALMQREVNLFSGVLEARNVADMEQLFDVMPSGYWLTHYRFDRPSVAVDKRPGSAFIHRLLINTVVPALYHYGRRNGQSEVCDTALSMLEALPAEDNKVLEGWRVLGERATQAGHAQALLHLKKHYCDARRCLECPIGTSLIR